MNILEYRELKAQMEKEEANAQTQQSSTPDVPPSNENSPQSESLPNAQGTETNPPNENNPNEAQFFDIEGQKVTLDELQRGYLRQSDYTKKTQDLARQQRELQQYRGVVDAVKQSPEAQQAIQYNPVEMERQMLEAERYDLQLQREVNTLSSKYADFEVSDVLNFALERKMNNLEDAYLLNKQYKQSQTPPSNNTQTPDVESLKAQIRAELEAEMNTGTIISGNSGNAPSPRQEVQLTPQQLKVARAMKMSPEEYVRWSQ